MTTTSSAPTPEIILEHSSRICGIIQLTDGKEYIISGTVDDLCFRDFVICTVYPIPPTDITQCSMSINISHNKPMFAYVGRPGIRRELIKQSMITMICVLEKVLGRSKHFPRLIAYGDSTKLVYGMEKYQAAEFDPRVKRPVLIIEHEHTLTSVLPCFSPHNCLPVQLALYIGLGMVRALAALHRAGFIHRLVMPHSFAYPTGCDLKGFAEDLIIIDLSLCLPYPCTPRPYVPFVGTMRYSSLRAHQNIEQIPADDIVSVIYVVAEFISGRLPWSYKKPTNVSSIVGMKKKFDTNPVFKRLPSELRELYNKMMQTKEVVLDYDEVLGHFKDAIARRDPKNKYTLPEWLDHPNKNKGVIGWK